MQKKAIESTSTCSVIAQHYAAVCMEVVKAIPPKLPHSLKVEVLRDLSRRLSMSFAVTSIFTDYAANSS